MDRDVPNRLQSIPRHQPESKTNIHIIHTVCGKHLGRERITDAQHETVEREMKTIQTLGNHRDIEFIYHWQNSDDNSEEWIQSDQNEKAITKK